MAQRFAVVLAGGRGERFWPSSRSSRPKQLLDLLGLGRPLLAATVARLQPLVPLERILVITAHHLRSAVQDVLPELPPANLITEPEGRDTAAAVTLAAALIMTRTGSDATMLVLPADHLIPDAAALRDTLTDCAAMAEQHQSLVAIGIPAAEPNPAYGYWQCGPPLPAASSRTTFLEVGTFHEKPDTDTAARLIAAGNCFWNSGIFAWTTATLTAELHRHAPPFAAAIAAFQDAVRQDCLESVLAEFYPQLPRRSIDHALLESARGTAVAVANFAWDDLGSWNALRRHLATTADGNAATGQHVWLDCHNCLAVSDSNHLVAAIGVDDLVIVQSANATLVCRRNADQRLKELLQLVAADPLLTRYL